MLRCVLIRLRFDYGWNVISVGRWRMDISHQETRQVLRARRFGGRCRRWANIHWLWLSITPSWRLHSIPRRKETTDLHPTKQFQRNSKVCSSYKQAILESQSKPTQFWSFELINFRNSKMNLFLLARIQGSSINWIFFITLMGFTEKVVVLTESLWLHLSITLQGK